MRRLEVFMLRHIKRNAAVLLLLAATLSALFLFPVVAPAGSGPGVPTTDIGPPNPQADGNGSGGGGLQGSGDPDEFGIYHKQAPPGTGDVLNRDSATPKKADGQSGMSTPEFILLLVIRGMILSGM